MKFFSCIFVLLSLFVSIVIAVTDQKVAYNVSSIIPAVFVFGDTVVDTGSNNWFRTREHPTSWEEFRGRKAQWQIL